MRKAILVTCCLLLCWSAVAVAQFTTVSGTIVDPNGLPYAEGTVSAVLVIPSGAGSPTLNGNSYLPPIQPAGLDLNGHFAFNVADNTVLLPPGTQWNFMVCSAYGTIQPAGGKGPKCFTLAAPITISGPTQDLTTQLNAVALVLAFYPSAGGGVTGSGTVNTIPIWTGATVLGDSRLTDVPAAGGTLGYSGTGGFNITGTVSTFPIVATAGGTSVSITAANNVGGTNGGSQLALQAGGVGAGGVSIIGGTATSGTGGSVVLTGGNASDNFQAGNIGLNVGSNSNGAVGAVIVGPTANNPSVQINGTVGNTVYAAARNFSNLGTPPNGQFTYCPDCNNTCSAGSSSGQFCQRLNSNWVATGAGGGSGTVGANSIAANAVPNYPSAAGSTTIAATHLNYNDATNVLNIGVAGNGTSTLGLVGNTSGTATIAGPAVAGTSSNPIVFSNVLQTPNGAQANPAVAGSSNTAGIYFSGPTGVQVTSASVDVMGWGGGSSGFAQMKSTGLMGFANTTALGSSSTMDAYISRSASKVIAVGGNSGNQGDTTGSLKFSGLISVGTKFTTNGGCGETSGTTQGGATKGRFTTSGSTSCTSIVTMGDGDTAPNHWACTAHDLTTAADYNNPQVLTTTTTTATIVTGTIVANDVIEFSCDGY
jgi:hypothetical protein